jgi:hypothetical protein
LVLAQARHFYICSNVILKPAILNKATGAVFKLNIKFELALSAILNMATGALILKIFNLK